MKIAKARLLGLILSTALIFPVLPATKASAATLNITSYGANGSDTNDDRTAINNAINAASSGDTVYFPSGTYYISGSINGKSGVKLEGQSRDTTIIKFSGTSQSSMILLNNTSNAEVTQLTLDGNSNVNVYRGISGEPGSGAKIHHNRIKDFVRTTDFGPFGVFFAGSANVEISDNEFMNMGLNSQWGGAIRVGYSSTNPKILRNTITNTGRGGIFLNDNVSGAIVRENIVTGTGPNFSNLGLSIELHTNVNNSIVEDNVVDHWLSIVISDFNAVRRNTVKTYDGTYKSYGLEISSGNSIVTDNWVDGGQHLGISSSSARDYTFYGYNRIENMIQWGMQFFGQSATVKNNQQYFYKNKFLTTDKDNSIATYDDYAGFGVRLHGYSTNITFDSNEISNNDRYGIDITSTLPGIDQISFINNTITNNGLATYDYYPSESVDLEWSGNTISGNNPNNTLTSRGFSNQKPVANFTAPTSVFVGQTIAFNNTSTDADGTISHNLWDFGEGLPTIANSPTYAYTKPGTYRVTLMTTDNGGRSTIKEQTIVVTQGPPDTTAPTVPTGLTSPSHGYETVNLSWNASSDFYGVSGYDIYQNSVLIGSTNGSTTTFQATGLQMLTTYSFTVRAKDATGNVSAPSSSVNVTTSDAPGGGTGSITREYWSNISGTTVAGIPVTTTPTGTATLLTLEGPSNWADNYGTRIRGYITPEVSGSYTFYLASDNAGELWLSTDSNPANLSKIAYVTTYTGYRAWTATASQQSTAISLTAGQPYYVEVLHKEGQGEDYLSVGWTGPGISPITVIHGGYLTPFSTGTSDTQAPTTPSGLSSPSKTTNSVNLSWTASTDNVGVTGYDVFKNGVLDGSTTGTTTYTVSGLTANTAYSFTVKAKDAAGNLSAASTALSVTTNQASDTQAPTVPSGLSSPSKTTNSVNLSWTASTDNVGVTGYDVFKNGILDGSTTGATTYTASGLTANTAYLFTVKAKDAAGNISAASTALSVTTNANSGGGTGTIIREYWTGVGGDQISDIPVSSTPTGTSTLTSLEGPSNWANGYATRIRGYITPTTSGAYTFYIASDNAGELWLSTDNNPANKVKVAYVSTWTNYRQWTASATQHSASLNLTAGQSYYVEVLHKESTSADHVSVGWTGPGISTVTVIDGSYLSPY